MGREVIEALKRRHFVVVMMPTGSGKTLLEVLIAWFFIREGLRVLVLEPTRFLVDQVFSKVWKPVLRSIEGGVVGSDYEGRCGIYASDLKVIISTPKTALKCSEYLTSRGERVALIVDEVHHAYSSKYYRLLIKELRPIYLVGFTALVPSERRLRLPEEIKAVVGEPEYLAYDFSSLSKLGDYVAPKAVLDVYDAELGEDLLETYVRLRLNLVEGIEGGSQSRLASTLMKYGLDAFCSSLENLVRRGKADPRAASEVMKYCLTEPRSNHKVRALLEVLSDYWDVSLRPIIVFTSRVPTAEGIAEVIRKTPVDEGLLRVRVLTGRATKEERLRIIEEAKKGLVDVVVSTRVGEEGVDLPEAGVLVLLDTTVAPLRFYQRLGRLIRKSRPSST